MALAPTTLTYLDTGHTGGREVASDILLPDRLLEKAYVVLSADALRAAEDALDHDLGYEDFSDLDDEPEDNGPLWVWRKPRNDKD